MVLKGPKILVSRVWGLDSGPNLQPRRRSFWGIRNYEIVLLDDSKPHSLSLLKASDVLSFLSPWGKNPLMYSRGEKLSIKAKE